MNNSEQTTNLEKLNTDSMFDRIFRRTQMLTNHKDELLGILNTFESATSVISEIQHGSVITQTEHRVLKKFIEDRGLSTDISSVYEETLTSRDKDGTLNHLINFTQFIDTYPYVVDADQVSNIHKPLSNDIVCIRKDNKLGIIKKGIDKIEYLLNPDTYTGVLTTTDDEYNKYGIVEIVNSCYRHDEDGRYCRDYNDTTFLKVCRLGDGISKGFCELGRFNLVTNFDKDSIAVAIGDGGRYYFVHKHFVDRDNSQIYRIGGSFGSNRDTVKKGFDEYNSFTAKGGMMYKKRYNKDGNFDGIDIFKKSLMGKETLVGNYKISK